MTLDDAMDAAQQIVTACLHDDRSTASSIATECPHPVVLALVLADLVAYTHHQWAKSLGMNADEAREGWAHLMADIEEWRSR